MITIEIDDLKSSEIAEFLAEHLDDMQAVSPPESKHALDLDALRAPDIVFWSIRDGATPMACGAIKKFGSKDAEIKSMRVGTGHRKKGLGALMLEHIIAYARAEKISRLLLETGSMDYFVPARQLYLKYGFDYCEPFADYEKDENSVFMVKQL